MNAMASQITRVSIVCLTVCSSTVKRKHQCSVSLAFVRGIHRGSLDSPHKRQVTRKMFNFRVSSCSAEAEIFQDDYQYHNHWWPGLRPQGISSHVINNIVLMGDCLLQGGFQWPMPSKCLKITENASFWQLSMQPVMNNKMVIDIFVSVAVENNGLAYSAIW